MKILHLLTSGGIGGIEILCKDISIYSNCDNLFCFLFGDGNIYSQMKEMRKAVFSFQDSKKLSTTKFKKLQAIAIDCDIVVVHHDDPFLEMYYLALKKTFPKKKYISMVHHCYDPIADNLGYGFVKRFIKHHITKIMFKKSDKLIFVSKAGMRSYQGKFRLNLDKTSVIYNGVGDRFINDGKAVEKCYNVPIRLLYVGRLVELKGVDVLIDILPKVIKKHDIYVDIVGDGRCRINLENKVKSFGIEDKVCFHGFKSDVTPFLSKADIFIYPSKTEIFGISIVEAMAYKCICVANNVGGIPEIINDGLNGFLNKSNTPNGLEKSINKAIEIVHSDTRRRMMNSARKTAENFTIHKTINKLEKTYKELLEG